MLLHLDISAYVGNKLVFREEAFVNLRKLYITSPSGLREVRFEKGASPKMEMIEFGFCDLESGIIGINHLPVFKQISLGYKGKVGNLDILQGEVDAHPNHPVLQLRDDRSKHDLRSTVQGSDDAEAEEETNLSQDHDIGDDDFLSCISDDEDAN